MDERRTPASLRKKRKTLEKKMRKKTRTCPPIFNWRHHFHPSEILAQSGSAKFTQASSLYLRSYISLRSGYTAVDTTNTGSTRKTTAYIALKKSKKMLRKVRPRKNSFDLSFQRFFKMYNEQSWSDRENGKLIMPGTRGAA